MNNPDEFEIILAQQNGKTVARIPQLGLAAAGDDIAGALASLETSKKKLMAELEIAGLQELVMTPPSQSRNRLSATVVMFAIKSAIVAGVIIGTISITTSLIVDRVAEASRAYSGGRFWTNLETRLASQASSAEMPEAQKQKILADIRVVADRWRPFVIEATRIFSDTPKATDKPKTNK